jgi:arylformamidase
MDAPAHFNRGGLQIAELPMEYFVHDGIFFTEIPKKAGEGVTADDLRPFEHDIKEASLLIIKTGFESARSDDPGTYSSNGPYLAPDCCSYLISTFKDLRVLGFDFLSVGSPSNGLAAESHQILLGCGSKNYICAVEDMKLDMLAGAPKRVIIAPLRVSGIDSSQVTVLAEI